MIGNVSRNHQYSISMPRGNKAGRAKVNITSHDSGRDTYDYYYGGLLSKKETARVLKFIQRAEARIEKDRAKMERRLDRMAELKKQRFRLTEEIAKLEEKAP